MLEKVRKVKAILTLDDVFQEGEIFFEFFDYPNHFYKEDDNNLSCMMYMRSCDLFLGLPINIASTGLLTMIIAKVMNMKAKEIVISICDIHIYEEHLKHVNIQLDLKDKIFKQPELKIKKEIDTKSIDEKIKWIEELKYEDFELINYNSHGSLKAIMK
jgi:thymidylate synthase